jgi:hypothetical protein
MNSRYDVLAWNEPYATLFPAMVNAPPEQTRLPDVTGLPAVPPHRHG